MGEADGGVFIYHPLNPQNALFSIYESAQHQSSEFAHALSKDDESRLLKRYRLHMGDVLQRRGSTSGVSLESEFKQDGRDLVHRFRKFFPSLLEKTTLTDHAAKVAVFFPVIDCFDNRCIEIKGHNEAIFVTSRTLDAIELFAETLSMCVRLNGLELAVMLGMEDPPPAHVLLAWMTMMARPMPDIFNLDAVLGKGARSEKAFREELYSKSAASNWLPEVGRVGWGHYRLSISITRLMLIAIHALVRGDQPDSESFVRATRPVPATTSGLSMDSQYLATLILSFIVLHEIGHFALGHNNAEGPPVDPVLQKIVDASMAQAEETGAEGHNLIGSFVGHETGADGFALDVIDEQYRDPMLEAASLWCAALSGTNDDCGDWLDNFSKDPRGKYPAFSMRVWFMNGRFSQGRRQGRIAQEITKQAEALSKDIRQTEQLAEGSFETFQKLWAIASKETGAGSDVFSRLRNLFGKS
jgi:hypothetical protein